MPAPRRPLTAEPLPAGAGPPEQVALPEDVDDRRLLRRALAIVAVLAFVALIALLAPGLGEVRDLLENASAGWIALAVLFEVGSCLGYALMFRPIFCPRMSRRTSAELSLSEVGVGSLVPAAGLGGLALGVWALRRGGMPADEVARRTVAFFVIKSAANFAVVAAVGLALFFGGSSLSWALTLVPGVMALLFMGAVASLPRIVGRTGPVEEEHPNRRRRALRFARGALSEGIREAGRLLRSGDPRIYLGSLAYYAFDNAVLWAAFEALGEAPGAGVILLGYLIGQLGGLLPLPGGLGGIDGGLVGTLAVYGTPLASATAAVLLYRFILFWVPLAIGAVAFVSLRRGLNRPDRPDLCAVPA